MAEYVKPWLSVDEQIEQLAKRGIEIDDSSHAELVLRTVGYYRLTGYLYPFRQSEPYVDADGTDRVLIHSTYHPGTTLRHAEEIIDFDRRLRMLVMEGVERIEIAFRMQIGYVLGRRSPFAHEDPDNFTAHFTAQVTDSLKPSASEHVRWLQGVSTRRAKSDEQFVQHFGDKYDNRIPIWALTEILELGQISRLYRGLAQHHADEIAASFSVPTKKLMGSWLASLNYVRNVAAHHARLFNRKLQNSPGSPKEGQIPLLDHLRHDRTAKKKFGIYRALAVIAYLLTTMDTQTNWIRRMTALLREFPTSHALTIESLGAPLSGTPLSSGAVTRHPKQPTPGDYLVALADQLPC